MALLQTAHYRLLDPGPDSGPLADEALLAQAADGPVACLWQAPQGLVVPRTYAARPGFAKAQSAFAAQGWPIQVRQSGGGIVPQGPGILNISLAQVFQGRPLDHSEALYQHLCGLIATALLFFGIETHAQAVEGSFCDGRYNLAIGSPARKIAGTAQWWRRLPAGQTVTQQDERQIGLVHALILLQCNTILATDLANALETALDAPRRYAAEKAISLDLLLPAAERAGFPARFQQRLADTVRSSTALGAGSGCCTATR